MARNDINLATVKVGDTYRTKNGGSYLYIGKDPTKAIFRYKFTDRGNQKVIHCAKDGKCFEGNDFTLDYKI